jgi:hypothetical protein
VREREINFTSGGRRKRNSCRNIIGDPESKRLIGIPRSSWEYYKKII